MISVNEAERLLFDHLLLLKSHSIRPTDLCSEVLQEALIADRNYPPFDRVAMDGIAVSYSTIDMGRSNFQIENIQRAGEPSKSLQGLNNCFEVMTGAVLPEGCDTVIRYEDVTIKDGYAHLNKDLSISKSQNIHHQGTDFKKDDLLIEPGELMLSPQWAVSTSIGKSELKVSKRPKIAIVSTGDELVEVHSTPEAHQIRMSNVYTLLSSLRTNNFTDVELHHVKDEKEQIHQCFKELLTSCDVLIISGGVSKGKFDFIPSILNDCGVKSIFYKVAQKPGKPLWFGSTESKQMVFGLPGNPTSTVICLHRYVLPALWKSLAINPRYTENKKHGILTDEVSFKKPMTYFLPVKVTYNKNGETLVTPVENNGSGDFNSLTKSDGFIELDANKEIFPKNTAHPLYLWREGLC